MARYWRLVNLLTDSGALSLSEVMLYDGTTKIVTTASSTVAPVSGALTLLEDGLADVAVSWARCSDPGFAVVLDAGVSYPGVALRLGSGASAADYPRDLTLQTSADLINWTTQVSYVHATWPGAFSLTPAVGGGVAGDLNYSNVSLLLAGNGTNGSTTFTDNSPLPKAVTAFGNTQVRTAQSKFGGSSIYFDGAGDYLSIPASPSLDFAAGDFTVEAWVYLNAYPSAGSYMVIASKYASATSRWTLYLGEQTGTDSGLKFAMQTPGPPALATACGSPSDITSMASAGLTLGAWHHIAATSAEGTIRAFLNGTLLGLEGVAQSTDLYAAAPIELGVLNASAYPLNGYIDDLRITKGVARYIADFTPPTQAFPTSAGVAVDTNYSSVSLLLAGNGANGSTTFTDNSPLPKVVTAFDNAKISTAQSKFGGSSIYFDGVSSALLGSTASADLNFSGDFTVEFFYYCISANTSDRVFTTRNGDVVPGLYLSHNTSTQLQFYCNPTGSAFNQPGILIDILLNVFQHIAIVKTAGVAKAYVNGAKVGVDYNVPDPAYYSSADSFNLGGQTIGLPRTINGYIDDFRITKGVARYTANFTPPTQAFPTSAGASPVVPDPSYSSVTLLLNGDLIDKSAAPKTVMVYGNAQSSTVQSKFGGSSMYFDGAGDYLSVPASAAFYPAASFTVECWVYLTAYSGATQRIAGFAQSSGGDSTWYILVAVDGTVWFGGTDGTYRNGKTTSTVPLNTWVHIAGVATGGVFSVFLDGVKGPITEAYGGLAQLPSYLGIGRMGAYDGQYLNGYIDDLRITNGVARYIANFTPPAAAFSIDGLGDVVGGGFTVDSPTPNRLRLAAPSPDLYLPAVALPDTTAMMGQREQTFADVYHGGTGTVSGTVKEKNSPANTPLRRRVLLVDEASRLVIREAWSDSATGAFSFIGVAKGVKYSTVSYDHLNNYRAVIADNQEAT